VRATLAPGGVRCINIVALCDIIVREVRNENHEIPEKGSNPEKGSIPKMDLTFFSLLEVLTGYCKMLLSTVLKS
jgi:hypothetical protein